jgi:hypothetical protein
MPIDYDKIKNWPFPDVVQAYTEKDSILYALGVGYGHDPMDEAQLRFVYEKNLLAAPTMPVVLGYPGFWMKDPASGIDWVKIVHGEQALRLHRPIPAAGTVIGRTRVKAVVDKGRDKGRTGHPGTQRHRKGQRRAAGDAGPHHLLPRRRWFRQQ